jgi:hypothetical protein
MVPAPEKVKTAGRRKAATGPEAAAGLLRLVIELRAGRPFIPRGVHCFRSFEEAQEWSLKMMARPSSRDRPRSTALKGAAIPFASAE